MLSGGGATYDGERGERAAGHWEDGGRHVVGGGDGRSMTPWGLPLVAVPLPRHGRAASC